MATRSSLAALLVTSILFVVLGALVVFRILLAIEAQIAAKLYDSYAEENNLELKVEENNGAKKGVGAAGAGAGASAADMSCGATDLDAGSNYYASVNDHHGDPKGAKNGKGGGVAGGGPRVARMSNFNRAILAFLTSLLVLLAYLLLVVSDAPPLLARLGLLLCATLVLQRQILHEVRNEGDAFDFSNGNFDSGNSCLGRGRYDRLAFLAAALLVVTSAMNLATYASRLIAVEDVYVGPARIVGYDTDNYKDIEDSYRRYSENYYQTTVTSKKTDLEVAWGGAWGCPHVETSAECRADLAGALCEMDDTKVEEEDAQYGNANELGDGVGEEEESRAHEVHYDSNGEKVVTKSKEKVEHSKAKAYDDDDDDKYDSWESLAGGVVEDHATEETTRYNSKGGVDSRQEDGLETQYDSDTGNLEYEMAEESSVDYTASGDVDASEYVLDENIYNGTDGVLLESAVTEEVVYGTEGGGKEDTSEYLDLTYEDNVDTSGDSRAGQLEEETYDIAMTETNADGKVTSEFEEDYMLEEEDGVFKSAEISELSVEARYENGTETEETLSDAFYEEGSDYSIDEEFVTEEEITYDGEGHVKHEEVEEVDEWNTGDGGTEHDAEHETLDYSSGDLESYQGSSEEIVYDEDGNVVEDVTQEYGDRGRTLRGRRADETALEEEEENEELKQEIEELEEENEALKEELAQEEGSDPETVGMGTDAAPDDDEDADWNDVWGDYKCYNLFDADLDGTSYNATVPAGEDDWPYLKVYGNCRTCEAFVVDRFSADHFSGEARAYGTAGRNDAVAAALALVVALLLAVRRRMSLGKDGEGGDNKAVNFL